MNILKLSLYISLYGLALIGVIALLPKDGSGKVKVSTRTIIKNESEGHAMVFLGKTGDVESITNIASGNDINYSSPFIVIRADGKPLHENDKIEWRRTE